MNFDYLYLFPRPKKEDQKILDDCWRRLVREAKDHPIEIKLCKWPNRKEGKDGQTKG